MACVWVAMSGGVDSSVAAARLVAAGHDVTGVTMQLLPEGDEEGRCCSTDAVRSARRVCDRLGVPHYTLNMRDVFASRVVDPFTAEYASGRTPNPCIACNDRVKFVELLARARTAGADALATGHYARIVPEAGGDPWLARGRDEAKDQSYFLYRLTRAQMAHVCFPLGDALKTEIRAEAAALGLPSAARADSQEVCFVPDGAGAFVASRVPGAAAPGEIRTTAGALLGAHEGVCHFTVGQRKGLGLPAGPWYVTRIDAGTRTVIVDRAPAKARSLTLSALVWHDPAIREVGAQLRYRATPAPAVVTPDLPARTATIEFAQGIEQVAPGQAVVCYVGDRVVGGGVVETAS